jgi:hypothetical protein
MNLAVTEVSDGMFTTYVVALGISGIVLLLAAAIGFGSTAGARVLSGIIGLGFLGYAIYLQFFLADGAEFRMFFYAFIAPVLAIINIFRSRKPAAAPAAAPANPAPPAA